MKKLKIAVLLIITICVLIKTPYILSNDYSLSPDWSAALGGSGDVYGYYTYQFFNSTNLRNFAIPFWNPYFLSGVPHTADWQASPFSPYNLLLTLFVNQSFLNFSYFIFQVGLIFFIECVGIYLLISYLTKNRIIGLSCSVFYLYLGFFNDYALHLPIHQSLSFLPLLFYFLERFRVERTRWALALAGVCLSLVLLGGHSQPSYYIVLAVALFIIFHLVCYILNNNERSAFSWLKNMFLLFVFGVGFSAIQLVPTLELLPFSVGRGSWPLEHSLNLTDLKGIILPLSGYPSYLFIGFAPALFVLSNLLKKSRTALFYAGLTILALLLSPFKSNPFYILSYNLLPLFSGLRCAERVLMLYGFSITVLLGLGIRALQSRVRDTLLWFFPTLLFGLYLIGFVIPQAVTQSGIKSLFVADRSQDIETQLAKDQIAVKDFLKTDTTYFRVYNDNALGPNYGIFSQIDMFDGYQTRMQLASYDKVVKLLQSQQSSAPNTYPSTLDLLNVKYVLSSADLEQQYPNQVKKVFSRNSLNVFERVGEPLPRAYLVGQTGYIPPNQKSVGIKKALLDFINTYLPAYPFKGGLSGVVDNLKDPDVVKGAKILVQDPDVTSLDNVVDSLHEDVFITDRQTNTVSISTTTENDKYLVLNQTYYPGWQVTIDGEGTPVFPVNFIFSAIKLPSGVHEIEFRFDPWSFKIGAGISLLSFVGLVVCLSWERVRRRLAMSDLYASGASTFLGSKSSGVSEKEK